MVEHGHEHHRRRIHKKARAIHVWLIPAALIVPVTWLYLSYGVCQEAESPLTLQVCAAVNGSPYAPIVLGLLLLAWLARDLAALGALTNKEPASRHARVRHGYHALEHEHKRHVRVAVAMVVAISVAMTVALAFLAYRTTH